MEEVDATTARRGLRLILDRAHVHGEETAITRHGEIIAVVVPAGLWRARRAAAGEVAGAQHGPDRSRDE